VKALRPLAGLLVAAWSLAAALADAPRPNVLLIMADDLRTEVASYGSPALTPNLSRLAARSVQFNRAYCQQAVCNPSRSSMLTGRRPDSLGVWCNSVHFRQPNPEITTLPLWFKEHGYTTRCTGKIFHNWRTDVKGDPRSWSAPEFLHFANHGDDKPQVAGELAQDHATAPRCECRDVPDEAYFDGRVAAEAVRVLAEIKDQPFFLAVGFWKPHAPFNAPKRYWDKYDRAKLPPLDPKRPAGVPEIALHDGRELLGVPPNQRTLTPEQVAEIRHGYFANVAFMDTQVGKVLDALDKSGAADRTIVVFAADHGYHIGEHSLWGKTSNFELDARVPLMIAAPGVGQSDTKATRERGTSAGQRSDSLVELLDLFPTLTELCDLAKPDGVEGTSLVPVLRNPDAQTKTAAFTQHPRPAYYDNESMTAPEVMGYSVRTPRLRYTEWRDWKTGQPIARELYDATADPAEMKNAIDDPALASAQREAEALLAKQFPRLKH
jgi:iduronate 2-sulfatase